MIGAIAPVAPQRARVTTPSQASQAPATPGAWDAFLRNAKSLRKEDLLSAPSAAPQGELPAPQSVAVTPSVVLVPKGAEPGVKQALKDLADYLAKQTGRPTPLVEWDGKGTVSLPPGYEDATVVAMGLGDAVPGLVPAATGSAEGYSIQATQATVGDRLHPVIGLNGDDLRGRQYAVYRLMELSGARFFSYSDTFTPAAGEAKLPADGFSERHAPPAQMKVRGFSPHLYHPIPLSTAFHEPSDEHLAMMKRYVDWCVQNRQNYVQLPLLDLDASNHYAPLHFGDKKFDAWVPYAKQIVDYAHARGVEVSINVAFAEFVSSNVYAINPVEAMWQSFQLARKQKAVDSATGKDLAARQADYDKTLDAYAATDRQKIGALIDKLMQVPWDEFAWNMGTSEFTPTSDDLTIRWMNDAAAHVKAHYPDARTTVNSHVPSEPRSKKYDESYFNLVKLTDPDVGILAHTTHAYSLTDPAPVYGNTDFTGKLKMMYDSASPERLDLFYPETSYWVSHDVTVPLFLPMYMLSRKQDLQIVSGLHDLDGEVTFTTGWEWGYWLSDYAVAKLQEDPNVPLTDVLQGALAPMGPARDEAVRILAQTMQDQQRYLIEKGLIKDLQGSDGLSDLGAKAGKLPVVGKMVHATNNVPERLAPATIMKWSASEIAAFEAGELKDLQELGDRFDATVRRMEALAPQVAPEGQPYYQELLDGYRINALRAREVRQALTATALARKAEIARDPALKAQAKAQLAAAQKTLDDASKVITQREAAYRDKPEDTYVSGHTNTMWSDRYLTRVHTLQYWHRTVDEVARLLK